MPPTPKADSTQNQWKLSFICYQLLRKILKRGYRVNWMQTEHVITTRVWWLGRLLAKHRVHTAGQQDTGHGSKSSVEFSQRIES